ncbi:MAG: hypothetical protein HFG15_01390 [Bacilli bacterium]|nr:hypothetical protein [Bacilli bacterium]
MHNIIFYLKNITFVIVCGLFAWAFPHLNMVIDGRVNHTMGYLLVFIILFIQIIILWRRGSKVNENNWYNGLFFITNLVFIMIYLRASFDTSMVTVYRHLEGEQYLFLHYNLGWIVILYSILIIYPLTYITFETLPYLKKNEK